NGIAYLTAQGDGSYVIENIHSNLNVTVTVSPYSISDPDGDGNGSGNSSGNGEGSGDGNNSAGDSSDGIPYWIPVLAVAAFIICIAAAAAGNAIIKRRKS
ncbi:MAG: hypothetical protein LBJ20_04935, partial [Candidatus Methanoplasma sp.]|nr:hypothetical protein [Candidatus Methanoplasma sp.]